MISIATKKLCSSLLLSTLLFAPAAGAEERAPLQIKSPAPIAVSTVPDSAKLEKDLQSLSWPQFSAVIRAVPQLKAGVDAYGAFGWQYVQAGYKTYRWRKSIDKLDAVQRRQLADLIAQAKAGKLPLRSQVGASHS